MCWDMETLSKKNIASESIPPRVAEINNRESDAYRVLCSCFVNSVQLFVIFYLFSILFSNLFRVRQCPRSKWGLAASNGINQLSYTRLDIPLLCFRTRFYLPWGYRCTRGTGQTPWGHFQDACLITPDAPPPPPKKKKHVGESANASLHTGPS